MAQQQTTRTQSVTEYDACRALKVNQIDGTSRGKGEFLDESMDLRAGKRPLARNRNIYVALVAGRTSRIRE